MNIVRYLPSAQFLVIVGSIALSGGLVVFAQQITHPAPYSASLSTAVPNTPASNEDWMSTLKKIEGANIGEPASAPTEESTKALLDEASSSNVTNTVARTLLINLSAAKSQGLGSDIPTQDKLVTEAVSKIKKTPIPPTYSEADIIEVQNTVTTLKTYGNAVMAAIMAHPRANYPDTLLAIGNATDKSDPSKLATLIEIQADYKALATDLSKLPTPSTLVPFHLRLINNVAALSATYTDMEAIFDDPLRSLAGLNLYQAINDENVRVFTNMAQQFKQNGILFNKDEPGSAWNSLLSL